MSEPNKMAVNHSVTDNRDPSSSRFVVAEGFKEMTSEQQAGAISEAIAQLRHASQDVQMRQLCYIFQADINYGLSVAKGLGIHIDPAMLQGLGSTVGRPAASH